MKKFQRIAFIINFSLCAKSFVGVLNVWNEVCYWNISMSNDDRHLNHASKIRSLSPFDGFIRAKRETRAQAEYNCRRWSWLNLMTQFHADSISLMKQICSLDLLTFDVLLVQQCSLHDMKCSSFWNFDRNVSFPHKKNTTPTTAKVMKCVIEWQKIRLASEHQIHMNMTP